MKPAPRRNIPCFTSFLAVGIGICISSRAQSPSGLSDLGRSLVQSLGLFAPLDISVISCHYDSLIEPYPRPQSSRDKSRSSCGGSFGCHGSHTSVLTCPSFCRCLSLALQLCVIADCSSVLRWFRRHPSRVSFSSLPFRP